MFLLDTLASPPCVVLSSSGTCDDCNCYTPQQSARSRGKFTNFVTTFSCIQLAQQCHRTTNKQWPGNSQRYCIATSIRMRRMNACSRQSTARCPLVVGVAATLTSSGVFSRPRQGSSACVTSYNPATPHDAGVLPQVQYPKTLSCTCTHLRI